MTTLEEHRKRVERIAKFLRLNYVAGTTEIKWADAEQDEREAWLAEASHIYGIAQGGDDDL